MKNIGVAIAFCLFGLTCATPRADSAQKPHVVVQASEAAKPVAKSAPAAPKAPAASASGAGGAVGAGRKDQGQPTRITSQRMVYAHDAKTVTFEGDVFVDRGDMQVWAERIVAHISAGKGAEQTAGQSATPANPASGSPADDLGNSSIEKIEAFQKVRIKREEKLGTCDKAVWDVPSGVITMTGSPVLSEGPNRIQGHTVIFRLKENRSEVLAAPSAGVAGAAGEAGAGKSGSSGRVEAFFLSPKGGDSALPGQGKAKP